MGAGILPTTIYNGELYFLFGKENKYEDSAPGLSDFGGGTDKTESYFETAIREACEELTGFLGDENQIRKLLTKFGTYNIDYKSYEKYKIYRMHIFPYEYNESLPYFYNNNQRFLQKNLPQKVFKTTKIFEKEQIIWLPISQLKKKRLEFRSYFQNIIDIILKEKEAIYHFIKKHTKERKNQKNKTRKRHF